jgi:hypothetical protein
MTLQQKINAFVKLGQILRESGEKQGRAAELAATAYRYNGWFTQENAISAFTAWGNLLTAQRLEKWLSGYVLNPKKSKT